MAYRKYEFYFSIAMKYFWADRRDKAQCVSKIRQSLLISFSGMNTDSN
jgi:hypothetical protein